jgi:hypothetical protein
MAGLRIAQILEFPAQTGRIGSELSCFDRLASIPEFPPHMVRHFGHGGLYVLCAIPGAQFGAVEAAALRDGIPLGLSNTLDNCVALLPACPGAGSGLQSQFNTG